MSAFVVALPVAGRTPCVSKCLRAPTWGRCAVMTAESGRVTTTVPVLKGKLKEALKGLNRGLDIDADLETTTREEEVVEDLIESLEDLNRCEVPVSSRDLPGRWELVYTSSSITRYFGGATGLQRLLPGGKVGSIVQVLDGEGICEIHEEIEYELFGKRKTTAVAFGKIRSSSEIRQYWDPEYVKLYFWEQFADGWKTLRAFQIVDNTYLDSDLRITRGQTGSAAVFVKT